MTKEIVEKVQGRRKKGDWGSSSFLSFYKKRELILKRKQVHKISTRVQIRLPKRKERREAFYCQKIWVKIRQPDSNLDKKIPRRNYFTHPRFTRQEVHWSSQNKESRGTEYLSTNGECDFKDLKDSLQSVRRVHLYQIVERQKDRYSVSSLYVYFGFPSFSYCFWLSKGRPVYKRFDANLAPKITAIFHDTQKGCRFIFYQPGRQYQLSPNPKTVLRYMRILGHQSPIRKTQYQYCTCTQREINEKARHVHYNVLARNLKAERPLQKLTTDVSYVYHKQGRMFLSVIKDCYDTSILAYTLSDFNDNKLVFDNIDLVFHDSWDSTKVCILHSGKGNCYDNAACENFFSHLKSESLRLFPPEDRETLVRQIREYTDWYNYHRPQKN